jgi:transcriptional regulator with XRE-family HTH domain
MEDDAWLGCPIGKGHRECVLKARRLSRGLSLSDAAQLSGLHFSYWSKLEAGQYESPSPKHLQSIAQALEVNFEDLYGLAGYDSPERLPTFKPYMRAKYDLPPEAVADLERYFELLRNFYGIPKDQPVFPPKPPARFGCHLRSLPSRYVSSAQPNRFDRTDSPLPAEGSRLDAAGYQRNQRAADLSAIGQRRHLAIKQEKGVSR